MRFLMPPVIKGALWMGEHVSPTVCGAGCSRGQAMAGLPLPPAAPPASMDWRGLFHLMNVALGFSVSTVNMQAQVVSHCEAVSCASCVFSSISGLWLSGSHGISSCCDNRRCLQALPHLGADPPSLGKNTDVNIKSVLAETLMRMSCGDIPV